MTVHIYSFVFFCTMFFVFFFFVVAFLYLVFNFYIVMLLIQVENIFFKTADCQSDPVHVNLCRTCMWTNQLVHYCTH